MCISVFVEPRNAMLTRYMLSSCVRPSARPSVCLSVTRRYCSKTAKRRIMQPRHTITMDSSLLTPKISTKFQRGHPQQKRHIEMGYVQIGDFRPISRYISEIVQNRDIVTMER